MNTAYNLKNITLRKKCHSNMHGVSCIAIMIEEACWWVVGKTAGGSDPEETKQYRTARNLPGLSASFYDKDKFRVNRMYNYIPCFL